MISIKTSLSALAVAGALTAASLGLGAAVAIAGPVPPPPVPAPPPGEIPPHWAPPKPAEFWNGEPVVWISGWGGRWGVWKNGYFMPLTSNPVTGGG